MKHKAENDKFLDELKGLWFIVICRLTKLFHSCIILIIYILNTFVFIISDSFLLKF